MARYRKKPVVVEAFQFFGESNTNPYIPDWFVDAVLAHTIVAGPDHIVIKTLEGEMRCGVGDWIIKGIQGEICPCKPDIFEATYEPAEPVVTCRGEPVDLPAVTGETPR